MVKPAECSRRCRAGGAARPGRGWCLGLFLILAFACPLTGQPQDKADAGLVATAEALSDFDARLLLARLLSYREATWEEALREYRILLEEQPRNTAVRREMADIYLWQKRYDQAFTELSIVLSQSPEDRQAQFTLGRLYLWRGDPERAAEVFAGLRSSGVSDPELLLELARAYGRGGLPDRAISLYRDYLQDKRDPAPGVYEEMADVYLGSDRKAEAVEQYRLAWRLDPQSASIAKKLGLALSWSGADAEALKILDEVAAGMPEDREVALERARIHARRQQWEAAGTLLEGLMARHPADAELIVQAADLAASRGHARRCRDLYRAALQLAPDREDLSLRLADQMLGWGDFAGAERICRDALKRRPGDSAAALKLAHVLASAQRYEEAEGIYRLLLLSEPDRPDLHLHLAVLKLMAKDLAGGLASAEQFLSAAPDNPEGLRTKAELLERMQRYGEALEAYGALAKHPLFRTQALVGMGRARQALGQPERAAETLADALRSSPRDIDARFYAAGPGQVTSATFLQGLLETAKGSPAELAAWAERYATNDLNGEAIRLLQSAVAADPDYFPARIRLAELTGAAGQYSASAQLYGNLAADFPESGKIAIGWARVLSWSGQYQEALDHYAALHRQTPDDPVVLKEQARVAVWGKKREQALQTYRQMLSPAVDETLSTRIAPVVEGAQSAMLSEHFRQLQRQVAQGSLYRGYETFAEAFAGSGKTLPPAVRRQVETRLAELLPAFRLQKAAFLEMEAKRLTWEQRPLAAANRYEALIAFNPGNEEALFDDAQLACARGLCSHEAANYERLLQIDPLHRLARTALEKQRIRSHPGVALSQWYWNEKGYGDLAQITRHRTDLSLAIPFACQYSLQITGQHWEERPRSTGESHGADGFTVGLNGVVNPVLRGEAGWTHKVYRESRFADRDSGFGSLWFSVRDYATIGIGYERNDEIANGFALRQGVQSDSGWISLASQLTRRLDASARARYLHYNDDNEAQHHSFGLGYVLTDHPRMLKLSLFADYRNTKSANVFHYGSSGNLTDITHPYWTPRNYLSGGLTAEWRHDLSERFFCGNDLHFYALRLSLGTDSTNNPLARLEGEWHYEFSKHWTVGIKGLLHRSQDWDGDSLWATVNYRF